MERMERDCFLIDKELVCRRFGKARDSYARNATVQSHVNEELLSLLKNNAEKKHFARALEIGCGPGSLTKLLVENFRIDELHLNDICPKWEEVLRHELGSSFQHFYGCDGEAFPFEGAFDLLVSASTLQWFHRPEQFFKEAACHMNKGGVLLFSSFGGENFKEIRAVTGKGLSYPNEGQLKNWLKNDYEIRFYKEELISLPFASPVEVLRHMKNTGVTATSVLFWGKKDLAEFCSRYNKLFANGGEVSLTYHPIYVYAVKK